MTKVTKLVLQDEVNCRFKDLDPDIRRKIVKELSFLLPHARHTPAFKLGRWDGMVSFATSGGGTYINLLDRVLPLVDAAGYAVEIEDQRQQHHFEFPEVDETFFAERTWPKGHPMAGQPIMLRDHQVRAINIYTKNLQSVQEIATGAGKTITTAALSTLCEPYGGTIVIVPSKSLVKQTEEDYRNIGLDVGVYFGERKETDRTHTIATWQSIESWAKASRLGTAERPISDFLKNIVCVMVDEAHSAKGAVLRELLAGPFANLPIRWGLTGTLPKQDFDFFALLGTLGPKVGEVRAVELQQKGILSDIHIDIIQTQDGELDFPAYHDEVEWLTTDTKRLNFIAQFVDGLRSKGNTLILVNSVEFGKRLEALIPEAKFISGATKLADRGDEYDDFNEVDDKILIATYGIASTGISITRIHSLVLMDAGKSYSKVIQSIGRGLRRGFDKVFANAYDICSNLKFSKRHLTVRKGYYKENEYPHKVIKTNYR